MFNLPNVITGGRLVLVPFIVWLTYSDRTGNLVLAAVLFALAVVSDWADGYVARWCRSESKFGALADPVVDKILILSLLFTFEGRGLLPMWLVLLNLFRELMAFGVRQVAAADQKVIGAHWTGKTKFGLQTGLILLIYAYLVLRSAGVVVAWGVSAIFWAALLMTVLSLVLAMDFFRRSKDAAVETP